MSIQVIGYSGTVANVDGSTYRALRITVRPVSYGERGSYRVSATTGNMAAYSNASIVSFRWADPNRIALVWGVDMSTHSSGGQTGGVFANLGLYIARNYTAVGSGGSVLTIPGAPPNNQKIRTDMGESLVSEIRVASTAGLTDGTWTLDSQPIGLRTFSIRDTALGPIGNFLGTPLFGNLEKHCPNAIALVQNEGFTIRGTAAINGTTMTIASNIAWSEVAIF